MHELTIADTLCAEVTRSAEERGIESVTSVTVRLGRLAGVASASLEFGFEIAAQNTPLEGATLVVEDQPVTVWCPKGDHAVVLDELILRCPEHGCPTPEVLSGDSLEIVGFAGDEARPSSHPIENPPQDGSATGKPT